MSCNVGRVVLEEFSHFLVAIFSLIFIGHLYQHLLFLSSFILNHTSRISSCKLILFLGCDIASNQWVGYSGFGETTNDGGRPARKETVKEETGDDQPNPLR